jgi:hypothetical protein
MQKPEEDHHLINSCCGNLITYTFGKLEMKWCHDLLKSNRIWWDHMGYRKPGSVVVQAEPSAHTVCGCSLGETAGVNSARGMDVILL